MVAALLQYFSFGRPFWSQMRHNNILLLLKILLLRSSLTSNTLASIASLLALPVLPLLCLPLLLPLRALLPSACTRDFVYARKPRGIPHVSSGANNIQSPSMTFMVAMASHMKIFTKLAHPRMCIFYVDVVRDQRTHNWASMLASPRLDVSEPFTDDCVSPVCFES